MNLLHRRSPAILLAALAFFASFVPSTHAKYTSATPPTSGPTVSGDRAVIRGGVAYAPENAPLAVKRAIWATNFLRNKPYVYGGGHDSFYEDGYDCSGSVSFLLKHAGALDRPAASGELARYGSAGRGRWITVYARQGHVFAVVAGLRLDTTGMRGDEGPRWRRNDRSTWGFTARHPDGM